MTSPADLIAASLGMLLQRRFRAAVYAELVEGIDAVDTAAYPVISGVERMAPVRVAVLGEEIGLDRSIVSRRAARLVSAGLIRSDPDPGEPRAALLSLTPKGQRTVAVMRQRLIASLGRQVGSWPAEDQERFAMLFARFVECWPGSTPGPRDGPAGRRPAQTRAARNSQLGNG